jgi:CheY-like chemotaxis protein
LEEILSGAFNLLASRASAKQLTLSYRVDDDVPPRLVGDAPRFRQILINLLDNAIKFTDQGSVSASVTALRIDDGELELQVAVADTGAGIPPERLERLFDMFEQVGPHVHQEFGGAGLGLAICRRFAEGMGGWIRGESEPRAGSTFTFAVRVGLPEDPGSKGSGEGEVVPADLTGARILVAEDNRVNQLVARRLLERFGCRVDTVDDGGQVLERVQKNGYDLVLMDLQMPTVDGLEATRRLRADPAGRGLAVVAMTANAQASVREACRAAGMDDYLTKPVDPASLREVIGRLIAGRSTTRP